MYVIFALACYMYMLSDMEVGERSEIGIPTDFLNNMNYIKNKMDCSKLNGFKNLAKKYL